MRRKSTGRREKCCLLYTSKRLILFQAGKQCFCGVRQLAGKGSQLGQTLFQRGIGSRLISIGFEIILDVPMKTRVGILSFGNGMIHNRSLFSILDFIF